jgi:hypothetical protein
MSKKDAFVKWLAGFAADLDWKKMSDHEKTVWRYRTDCLITAVKKDSKAATWLLAEISKEKS